jgi:hypothetical protein
MDPPDALVVAETASLGSAVYDLLVAGGLRVEKVDDLGEALRRLADVGRPLPRVLVSTPANRPSETARRWAGGPFTSIPLVVVGSRDPTSPSVERIHFVTLPLSPPRLLELVRNLAGRAFPIR